MVSFLGFSKPRKKLSLIGGRGLKKELIIVHFCGLLDPQHKRELQQLDQLSTIEYLYSAKGYRKDATVTFKQKMTSIYNLYSKTVFSLQLDHDREYIIVGTL